MADTHARSRRKRERKDSTPAARAAAAPSSPGLLTRLIHAPAWMLALGFAALHLVLAIAAFNPSPYAGGDNATYMALARSLAEHHRYLELWDPAMRPHTQYPPLWPAFLALLWMVGLRGWTVMKTVVLLCSVGAVGVSYLWLRRTSTAGVAFCAALLLAMAPGILELSHWELSDQPSWVLTMVAFWAATHLAGTREREGETVERRHGLWLGVLVAAVVLGNFVRAAGLPLVVATVAWLGMRRRWKDVAVLAAVFLPPAILWWLWGHANGAPGYTSFLWNVDPYRPAEGTVTLLTMAERLLANGDRYAFMHLPVMLYWNAQMPAVVTVPFLAAAIAGWARRLRKPGLTEVWVPLYVGLLMVWPSTWSGERFLLPLMPLMLCYAAEALRDVAAWFGVPMLRRAIPLAAGVLLLLVSFAGIHNVVSAGRECSAAYANGETLPCMNQEYHDLLRLAEITRGTLPPGTVVLSRKATLWYALSGYPSRTYPLSANPDTFFAFARKSGAAYVAFDNIRDLAPLYLHPVVLAHREMFCVVPGTFLPAASLLRIERGPPPPPGTAPGAMRMCESGPTAQSPAPPQPRFGG